MVVGARQACLSISKTVVLLGFFCTTTSYGSTEKKEKEIPVSGNSLLRKDIGGEWPD